MKIRRQILAALGAGILFPACARAQATARAGKPKRVGYIVETMVANTSDKPFLDALSELAWIEGRNIFIDRVYGDGDLARLPKLVAALVAREPDVIFARATRPVVEVLAHTRTIPVVFIGVSDPVEKGLVKSLAYPGGNVTGIASLGSELGSKRLHLLKQALPKARRVGVLVNPSYSPTSTKDYKAIEQAAPVLGLTLLPSMVNDVHELERAFALFVKGRVDALLITQTPIFGNERKRILEFAGKQHIPVVAAGTRFAEAGALLSYAGDSDEEQRRAAHLVDKVLRGTKPADIPVEQPTKFELVVNQRTAKALGISIPGEVMLQATKVLQ